MKPKIAVIMSCYNNLTYTPKAFKRCISNLSIQTGVKYCVIAINDGCKDETFEMLKSSKIPNLFTMTNVGNIGLTMSLCNGIERAKSMGIQYIAIHDADDYSSPDRLLEQSNFLDHNSNISVVGSFANLVNRRRHHLCVKEVPIHHEEIAQMLHVKNPMLHGCVMIRSNLFDVLSYDAKHTYAQDYGLWTRAVLHGFRLANLPKALVTKCEHRRSISKDPHTRKEQRRIFLEIQKLYKHDIH